MERADLIKHANGDKPADLLLRNARLVNVLTGEILDEHIAIAGDRVVGLGSYDAKAAIDLEGAFVAPGFIDAHVHIESSMVTPRRFSRAVVPLGTTTVVCDPHEIANVHGMDGVRFMMDDSADAVLDVRVMASSCVPATHMETSGATLTADDIAPLADHPRVPGLAEVMNFPGVIHADPDVLAKLTAFEGRVIDGHAPGVTGKDLCAYVAAGIGSDHECTTIDEAREKLRLGMMVFIREGTGARNLAALLPLVSSANAHRFCLCTDDRQPADLVDEGHIDHLIRISIAQGLDPVLAIRLATWNPARYFGLHDRGAITPGRRADLVVFEDLTKPRARAVYVGSELVSRDGAMLTPEGSGIRVTHDSIVSRPLDSRRATDAAPSALPRSMHIAWDRVDFSVSAEARRIRVIGVVPNQIVTEHRIAEPRVEGQLAVSDRSRDLLKIAVIERHHGSGAVGLGFVQGLGLESGALASSVAHDHHNVVVVGVDDTSMWTAARRVAEMGGGLAAANGDSVLADVPLPIAGLMSDESVDVVRREVDEVIGAARGLGSPLHDPFMSMSFLALEVIPELKITDAGLVDSTKFAKVALWTD